MQEREIENGHSHLSSQLVIHPPRDCYSCGFIHKSCFSDDTVESHRGHGGNLSD